MMAELRDEGHVIATAKGQNATWVLAEERIIDHLGNHLWNSLRRGAMYVQWHEDRIWKKAFRALHILRPRTRIEVARNPVRTSQHQYKAGMMRR